MITRQEYMRRYGKAFTEEGREGGVREHRAFYAQFVDIRTIGHVSRYIGTKRLIESEDENFNDIHMNAWDICTMGMPMKIKFSDVGDTSSPAGLVCVAKEAARQYIESREKNQ